MFPKHAGLVSHRDMQHCCYDARRCNPSCPLARTCPVRTWKCLLHGELQSLPIMPIDFRLGSQLYNQLCFINRFPDAGLQSSTEPVPAFAPAQGPATTPAPVPPSDPGKSGHHNLEVLADHVRLLYLDAGQLGPHNRKRFSTAQLESVQQLTSKARVTSYKPCQRESCKAITKVFPGYSLGIAAPDLSVEAAGAALAVGVPPVLASIGKS
ncbi:hypothetical protein IAQ61_001352 [Plenodomus lingam]|uniref:uncharacterized protein n=1 Tax=Leptosphaeria maculans TaxID=5022 RepID=UPI003317F944|nr:hypothetical protein IAQ61_001352 [Plenodomus lingam]